MLCPWPWCEKSLIVIDIQYPIILFNLVRAGDSQHRPGTGNFFRLEALTSFRRLSGGEKSDASQADPIHFNSIYT